MSEMDEAVARLEIEADDAMPAALPSDLHALLEAYQTALAETARHIRYIIELESEIEDLKGRLRHHGLL